jgi:hypothetical protein
MKNKIRSVLNGTKLRVLSMTFQQPGDINCCHVNGKGCESIQLTTTITRRDAGVEPVWTVSRRVVAGCARFMSRIHANIA